MPKKPAPAKARPASHRRSRSSATSIVSVTYWRRFAQHRFIYLLIAGVFAFGIIAYFGAGPGGGYGSAEAAREERAAEAIVTVNGEPVRRSEFETSWESMKRSVGGNEMSAASFQGFLLSQLIDAAMLRAAARQRGLTVPDSLIDETLREVRVRRGSANKPLTDDELLQMLGASSMKELRDRMRESLLPRVLGERLAGVDKLTLADLEKSYDEIKVRHILIGVSTSPRPTLHTLPDDQARRKAEKILAEARAGKDFAELANTYTTDPSNAPTKFDPKLKKNVPDGKPKGGDLGWYRRGGGFDKAFEDAAFALKPGQISDLVKTPFGYHIIKVDEIRRNLPKDFATAKNKYMEEFKQQRAREALMKFQEEERKKAKVVWKDPSLEWRYLYSKTEGMGGLFAGAMGGASGADQAALVSKLRTYVPQHPQDGGAALVLGKQLYNQYLIAGIGLPQKPGEKPAPQTEREKLRNEVIHLYESALKTTEDQEVRFTLAQLYEEGKQNDKALDQYRMIQRLLTWDDTPASKFARERLEKAFKKLGQPELAAQEAKKIAEITKKEQEEAKKRAEEEAKRKAEEAKQKAEQERAAQQKAATEKKEGADSTAPGGAPKGTAAPSGAPGSRTAPPPDATKR